MKILKKVSILCITILITCNLIFSPCCKGLTIKDEERLSREFLKVALSHYKVVNDALISNYVNTIGQKIISVLPPQPFKYHFYVIEDDVYNAFAGPAGHIFINSGLIEAMETEDELAGILSHEISHVSCRHIANMVEKSRKIGAATLAGVALGLLLGVGGGDIAASALTIGSIAAGKSASLAYSRENEMQADQIGLGYLKGAGYSAKGLLSILRKIRNKSWFSSEQIPTYLTTHPATEERIAFISSWIEMNEKSASLVPKTNSDFYMAHTRLLGAYGEKSIAINTLRTALAKTPQDPIINYGYGLIQARTGNLENAIEHLKTSLKKRAFDPFILKDLGRLYFLTGKFTEALILLQSGINIAPYDPERYFFLGRTQIKLRLYQEAIATFEKLAELTPNYPDTYLFLGKTYYELKRQAETAYYLGLHYNAKKEYKNAMFHLERAFKEMNDPEKKQHIQALLKKINKINKANSSPNSPGQRRTTRDRS